MCFDYSLQSTVFTGLIIVSQLLSLVQEPTADAERPTLRKYMDINYTGKYQHDTQTKLELENLLSLLTVLSIGIIVDFYF